MTTYTSADDPRDRDLLAIPSFEELRVLAQRRANTEWRPVTMWSLASAHTWTPGGDFSGSNDYAGIASSGLGRAIVEDSTLSRGERERMLHVVLWRARFEMNETAAEWYRRWWTAQGGGDNPEDVCQQRGPQEHGSCVRELAHRGPHEAIDHDGAVYERWPIGR